jgi:hypothetical protein
MTREEAIHILLGVGPSMIPRTGGKTALREALYMAVEALELDPRGVYHPDKLMVTIRLPDYAVVDEPENTLHDYLDFIDREAVTKMVEKLLQEEVMMRRIDVGRIDYQLKVMRPTEEDKMILKIFGRREG